jgi:hypothetical protein
MYLPIFPYSGTFSVICRCKENGGTEEGDMKESDILLDLGTYWVSKERRNGNPIFTVWKTGITHSTSDSSYSDPSIAEARCRYMAGKALLRPADGRVNLQDAVGKL